jgi:hypothetical protein
VRLLAEPREEAEATGRVGDLVEVLALQAVALWEGNERDRAVGSLGQALVLAEPDGYVRTFADEGLPMAEILSGVLQATRRGSLDPPSVHLDRAYDSNLTRELLADRGLMDVISEKGNLAPLQATKWWVVERTNSWSNAHKKKLVWCTKREGRVIDFWIAFSNVIIIVGRLIRKAWRHYRWQSRPHRRP